MAKSFMDAINQATSKPTVEIQIQEEPTVESTAEVFVAENLDFIGDASDIQDDPEAFAAAMAAQGIDEGLGSMVVKAGATVVRNAQKAAGKAAEGLKVGQPQKFDNFSTSFGKMAKNPAKNPTADIYDKAAHAGSSVGAAAGSVYAAGKSVVNKVDSAITGAADTVKNVAKSAVDSVKNVTAPAVSAAKSAAAPAASVAKSATTKLSDKIVAGATAHPKTAALGAAALGGTALAPAIKMATTHPTVTASSSEPAKPSEAPTTVSTASAPAPVATAAAQKTKPAAPKTVSTAKPANVTRSITKPMSRDDIYKNAYSKASKEVGNDPDGIRTTQRADYYAQQMSRSAPKVTVAAKAAPVKTAAGPAKATTSVSTASAPAPKSVFDTGTKPVMTTGSENKTGTFIPPAAPKKTVFDTGTKPVLTTGSENKAGTFTPSAKPAAPKPEAPKPATNNADVPTGKVGTNDNDVIFNKKTLDKQKPKSLATSESLIASVMDLLSDDKHPNPFQKVQLQELSKKTLKSYVKKATTAADRAGARGEKEEDKSMSTDGNKYPEKQKRHMDNASKEYTLQNKRETGVVNAKAKLLKKEYTKENFSDAELKHIKSIIDGDQS